MTVHPMLGGTKRVIVWLFLSVGIAKAVVDLVVDLSYDSWLASLVP